LFKLILPRPPLPLLNTRFPTKPATPPPQADRW